MTSLLIRGGRVIDPRQHRDEVTDVVIRDGRIVSYGHSSESTDRIIDATGMIVCPGFIDTHVGIRDPGFEEDETTQSATSAALAGGFTAIGSLPDTRPVVDNASAVEYVVLQADRARNCRVFPLGAVTRGHGGEELADLGQMARSGTLAFTDARYPIRSAEIMRRALEYARMFDCPIFSHPQDPTLISGGVMHEGYYSTRLGLRGMPAAAEEIVVGRDIALAELTRSRIHLMSISTKEAVDLVRRAKLRGVQVTCDVSPHHLALTDESLQTYDSNFKVLPPLRSRQHVDALLEGLTDGTIDSISSDHQPYAAEKKDRELDQVPFGIAGLETVLPICVETLIQAKVLGWSELIAKLTSNPARILGLDEFGTIPVGAIADVTVIDPNSSWKIDVKQFRSKSRNNPFSGRTVVGRVEVVVVGGSIRYERQCQGKALNQRDPL